MDIPAAASRFLETPMNGTEAEEPYEHEIVDQHGANEDQDQVCHSDRYCLRGAARPKGPAAPGYLIFIPGSAPESTDSR